VAQRIIYEIPRHRVFAEIFGGSAAITRAMLPAERNIVLDLDPSTVARFSGSIPHAEYFNADAIRWLSEAEIEHDWCIYADPPYHPDTLRGPQKYACKFDASAHLRLLVALMALPCPVLVSGYRCPLYDVTLRNWRRSDYIVHDRQNNARWESLWMNFQRPALLHDSRFVGEDKRAREARSRRLRTARGRARRADSHELQQLAGILAAECERRGVKDLDAVFSGSSRKPRLHARPPRSESTAADALCCDATR
jgi:site-specific DNA-adenine methylase